MDLIVFLKTHTKIKNDFIDDFFGLYDSKDKYNFSINIDSIAKWFKMRKDTIKATLKESYTKNIDYKIIKGISTGMKGKPSETTKLKSLDFSFVIKLKK